jgi:alginate O-acetyltransferase complex protein AlgI
MVFSSNLFLFAFLPLFLACYYACPVKLRSALILLFSYAFYAWWRPDFLFLLIGVSVGSYAFALAIDAATDQVKRYSLLYIAVALNLATLAYFKYANFGVGSFNAALTALGIAPILFTHVLLPIGLSFYIFHAISYLVDIYRKEAPPARNLIDFAAFIALFPHLVAGPVLRYHLLAEQFRSRVHSIANFAQGCKVFMLGFCLKVLIADSVAPIADAVFSSAAPSFIDAWLGTFAYTVQLFFDFSGYSSMAVGLALMIGFKFPENFNDPYLSTSITDFWKRWHMSLSNWLREYLYIPLGGNRKGIWRTYINLFLTMQLGGIWHGANWTFVAWGAWHGVLLAIEKFWADKHGPLPLPHWLRVAKTFVLVMIGWVFFRADSLTDAMRMFKAMLGMNSVSIGQTASQTAISQATIWQANSDALLVLLIGAILVYAMPLIRRYAHTPIRFLIIPLFVWALATLSSQSFTPFLYFQF